jgi:hypothetical protein
MPHPRSSLLAVGATLALLVGCDGASNLIEPPSGQQQTIVSWADGIRLTLRMDQPEYDLGEPVVLEFDVKNISDARRVFEFVTGCQHDFLVRQGDQLVWSLSHRQTCSEALSSFELGPGETWSRSDVWDQRSNKPEPVGPGSYGVTAELPLMGAPLETDSLKIVIR